MSRLTILVLAAGLLVAACGPKASGIPAGYVSRAMLGDEWPLTVGEGILRCELGSAVVIEVEDTKYAINGRARGMAESEGWRDLREIWAEDPDPELAEYDLQMDVSILIDRGLELCD